MAMRPWTVGERMNARDAERNQREKAWLRAMEQEVHGVMGKTANSDVAAVCRVAELRQQGIDAKVYLTWRDVNGRRVEYYASVRLPDGTVEGPPVPVVLG